MYARIWEPWVNCVKKPFHNNTAGISVAINEHCEFCFKERV